MNEMIFVVLGTQKFQLNRLLIQIDMLVDQGVLQEDIFAQVGHSDYRPSHYDFVDFLSKDKFEEKIENCSLLITHSGVGTIISGLNKKKPIIVFPRLKKYKEHVDNHQLQIAKSFEELNYVLLCNEWDNLSELIEKSKRHNFSIYHSQRKTMIDCIRQFLDSNP